MRQNRWPDAGLALALLALGGCAHMGAVQDVYDFTCADGRKVQASYRGQAAVVIVDGREHRLVIAPAASGSRYVGDGLQWWTRGLSEAQLAALGPGEAIAPRPGTACRAA
jgi:membrane-bound inhibitor of C-type lysozyme